MMVNTATMTTSTATSTAITIPESFVQAESLIATTKCRKANAGTNDNTTTTTTTPGKPFFTPPTYSIQDVHKAIPPHCFHRNTLLSLAYVVRDLAYILSLGLLATQIQHLPSSGAFQKIAWVAYAFCQGILFTGIWELAHECGHQALSPSNTFNNSCGLLLHSLLLVPYHSWRFTHARHHTSTNNIERDIAFVPSTKDVWTAGREARRPKWVFEYWDLVEDMPIVNLLILVGHQLIAWPIYLTINNFALPRMAAWPWWKRSHFYFGGDGPEFKPESRDKIIISVLGVGLAIASLWGAVACFGFGQVFRYYGAPWLWTNHWILTITFLQHTDGSLPYYPNKTWSFLRGAASTIDRDFGFIGSHFLHGAIEFHVVHHHASRIPFYNAKEASEAMKGVMGSHYRSDMHTPFMWAFWKNYNQCQFVEEKDVGSGVYFFGKKLYE